MIETKERLSDAFLNYIHPGYEIFSANVVK